jgi:hypothetical protein
MKRKHVEYRIYRNDKTQTVLPSEAEAFYYLKRSALRHNKADIIIEKREIVFDYHENVGDKERLNEFRV